MMTFEEWWKKQTTNFDPEEIGLMQLARITWNSAQSEQKKKDAEFITSKTVYDDVFSFSPEGLKAISKALLDNKD
jgi:hypothetical protein